MAPGDVTDSASGRVSGLGIPRPEWTAWIAALARRERALWAVALLATLADVATTLAGVHLGLTEGNPVIAGVLASSGVGGFLAVKVGVLAVAVGARVALGRYRVAIPLGLALPWAVAASANLVLLLGRV